MEINENFKPIGQRVLLKKLVKTMDKKYGDILIPHTINKNMSMGIAQVIDLGKEAKQETNLNKLDYVLYDYYSAFGNNPIYILTNAENIILQLTKEEADKYINNFVIDAYRNVE